MSEKTTILQSEEKRKEIWKGTEIRRILDKCTNEDIPIQIIKPGKGSVREHFCSDFHLSELRSNLESLKAKTEYSMVIVGDTVCPRYAISFTSQDVEYLVLMPHLNKTLVQIYLYS